eukprot:Mycagemm_TRINITY_DN10215_c0_g2::TRINITY_DN10215_c0_g2_i1::g.4146::m.4146 type:complete len:168 gc:universal TRINITY_DN10215_c0_g2_i1:891-1394(+)
MRVLSHDVPVWDEGGRCDRDHRHRRPPACVPTPAVFPLHGQLLLQHRRLPRRGVNDGVSQVSCVRTQESMRGLNRARCRGGQLPRALRGRRRPPGWSRPCQGTCSGRGTRGRVARRRRGLGHSAPSSSSGGHCTGTQATRIHSRRKDEQLVCLAEGCRRRAGERHGG